MKWIRIVRAMASIPTAGTAAVDFHNAHIQGRRRRSVEILIESDRSWDFLVGFPVRRLKFQNLRSYELAFNIHSLINNCGSLDRLYHSRQLVQKTQYFL
jgi:hypothetical protein